MGLFIFEWRLELLGPQDGHDQVDKAGEGDQAHDFGFHVSEWFGRAVGPRTLAHLVAEMDEGGGGDEERDREGDGDNVVHLGALVRCATGAECVRKERLFGFIHRQYHRTENPLS